MKTILLFILFINTAIFSTTCEIYLSTVNVSSGTSVTFTMTSVDQDYLWGKSSNDYQVISELWSSVGEHASYFNSNCSFSAPGGNNIGYDLCNSYNYHHMVAFGI